MPASLDTLARADFATLEGQTLALEWAEGQTTPATLRQVRSLGYHRPPDAGGRESFRFLLEIAPTFTLPQRIYALHHPTLGRIELFLVPIARDAAALKLEAIFNFA
ncbi:MAG: hypothetical protein IPL39_03355 [Opitutaceae bacterium]|nr:hypothetical protein [Opitutaceae bacterium]